MSSKRSSSFLMAASEGSSRNRRGGTRLSSLPSTPGPSFITSSGILSLPKDHALAVTANLSPGSMWALMRTCRTFWAGDLSELKQACLNRLDGRWPTTAEAVYRMEHVLSTAKLREVPWRHDCELRIKSLFPDGANRDEEGRLQCILAGSSVVQALLGETFCPKGDIDIFCTYDMASTVRARLIKAKLVCSESSSNTPGYRFEEDWSDINSVASNDEKAVIDHVEGYAAHPKRTHGAVVKYGRKGPVRNTHEQNYVEWWNNGRSHSSH